MKIMTFNIQHALEYKKNRINTKLFANKIKEYGADICGLNEVRGKGPLPGYTDQTNKLGDLLGFERYFGEAIKVRGKSPYGNALVSRYPIKSAETVMIPDPEIKIEGQHYETRCVIKAVADVDGKEICILVCHMGLAESERENAVRTICSIIDSCDLPIILMGDFNTAPESDVLKPIYERLSDTDTLSERPCTSTYPSYAPDVKIDYIFYRGLTCKSVTTIEEVISDHYPIIAEF